jgi:CheY-like chemotaxis protein
MTTSFRILHVDDDPLMRDVVDLSLALDPAFTVLSCATAREALAVVSDWQPDMIICDGNLPDVDGTALLARLRANPATDKFPVVFMSAQTSARETEAMKALGAAAVIAKPFDPAKLAETLRRHLHSIRLNAAGYDFSQRLRRDAAALAAYRRRIEDAALPEELQSFVHKLAGAAGIFNFGAVSATASALETAIIEARAGRGAPETVAANLDALLASMPQA